jgi:beta-galactosidase
LSVDRRELLAGLVALGAIGEGPALATSPAAPKGGALPMPAPATTLPPSLPIEDPGRTLMDRGWLFHEGDILPAPLPDHDATYRSVKAGNARGAAAMDYDDQDWQEVELPHDWASFQPFVETANVSQGYRPRGIGWYRRTLRLDPSDRGKRIELQFGGVATHCTIWVNGSVAAHNWSGYNTILVDLTPFARFGDELNVIAVRVDAEAMEGWWYEGAGLYRHVWLVKRPPVSIATDGVHCDPRQNGQGQWTVPIAVTLQSIAGEDMAVEVEAALFAPDGRLLARERVAATVSAMENGEARLELAAPQPALWSVEAPLLHKVEVRLLRDGGVVDERRIAAGFRTIRFDADKGLFLNGRHVKLKGVCLHQDHAGVGTAIPDALIRWRLERLKDMGANALRCTHNAPTAELLDWCDRLGILVMDENRQFDPAPDYLAQLEWMVRRDRNHACVILWSVFNEEPMQGTEAGVEMVRRMVHAVRKLDDSRPITAAMNGAFFKEENVMQVVDVGGFNYYQSDYDPYHAAHPAKPITSSEDTSAFMTRGAFASDPARHIASSYDTDFASWGASHRDAWRMIATRPFVAGGFVWTGFDYHGEPTPYAWPTISSFFGILDLCGFPKTAYDIHRAHWIDDHPVVALFPHWNWHGREGQPIKVMVMSNAERVELRLNGRRIGEAAVDRLMGNSWDVPFTAGRIEAIARIGGREVARVVQETTGEPVALRLTPARTVMAGDGEDAQPLTIDAIDAWGRHVPTANLMTRFSVEGAAVIGVGNGDPNSHEPEKGNQRSLFNGLAQIIIQGDATGHGRIRVHAEADGLRPALLMIDRLPLPPRAQVPVAPRRPRPNK